MTPKDLPDEVLRDVWFRVLVTLVHGGIPDATIHPQRFSDAPIFMDTELFCRGSIVESGPNTGSVGVHIYVRRAGELYRSFLKVLPDHSLILYPVASPGAHGGMLAQMGPREPSLPVSLRLSRDAWRLESLPGIVKTFMSAVGDEGRARALKQSGTLPGFEVGDGALSFGEGTDFERAPSAYVMAVLEAFYEARGDLNSLAATADSFIITERELAIAPPPHGARASRHSEKRAALRPHQASEVQTSDGCGCVVAMGILGALLAAAGAGLWLIVG